MNADDRYIATLLGIPIIGLLYCCMVIGAMLTFPVLRAHAPWVGGIVVFIPLAIGVAIWISPSSKSKDPTP